MSGHVARPERLAGRPQALMCAGEYIAPEMIEGALRKAGAVQQVFVHGEPGASALVAVAVPSEAAVREAAGAGAGAADLVELCATPAARAAVLDAMRTAGRQAGLKARGTPVLRWHRACAWRCMMSMHDAC